MSLSQPTSTTPCKKFITFKWSEWKFYHYDKEKGENIEIKTPFTAIVLDELATITGYHKKSDSGVYANEVRNTTKDILYVKSFKGGDITSGLYQEIKGDLQWGKYGKSVYCYLNWELVNFKLAWASLSAWIEKGGNSNAFEATIDPELKINGKTEYYVPVFTDKLVPKKIMDEAIEMDKELQVYLNGKLNNVETDVSEKEEDDKWVSPVDEDLDTPLPF